jgi:ABC-type glycerol-3-phosphate transport system substrate-binding protein
MMRSRVASIGIVIALAGCGGGPAAATPAPEEAVSITFWHGQSGVLGQQLQKLVDQFNGAHKIHVNASFEGSYTSGQLQQKIVAAIQAGNPPDMAQVPGPADAAQFLKAKALTPVQQFVDSPDGFTAAQLKDVYGPFLEDNRLTVNGKKQLVSWPMSKIVSVLYYNPNILQQAGISSAPKTWDELKQDLLTVKQKTQAVPLEWTPDLYYFWAAYLRGNGGNVLNKTLDKAAFNEDRGVAALRYETDLVLTDKTAVVTKGFDWQNDFANGKVAFSVSTSVSLPYIEQAMPASGKFKVGEASLPAGSVKAGNTLFGNNLLIFNKAPQNHQRAAWLFMKWLTDTDQTVAWGLASGYMPLRVSGLNSPTFQEKVAADPRFKVPLDAVSAGAEGVQPSPDWNKLQPVLNDMVSAALAGRKTPQQAISEAASKVNDILAGY